MALKIELVDSNTGVTCKYHKILTVEGNGEVVTITLGSYPSKKESNLGLQPLISKRYLEQEDAEEFLRKAYVWLKKTADFLNSEDD